MDKKELKKIKLVLKSLPKIKLAYFFGSRAAGKSGSLSDYDFALYLNEKDKKKMLELKFVLLDKISRILKTDAIDIVILNLSESPELNYQIIKEGKLIFERAPFRVIVEPMILNRYFDFHDLLLRHKLTKN